MDALFMMHPVTRERVKVELVLPAKCRGEPALEPSFEVLCISVWRNGGWQPCREEEQGAIEALLPEMVSLYLHTRQWSDLPFDRLYPFKN